MPLGDSDASSTDVENLHLQSRRRSILKVRDAPTLVKFQRYFLRWFAYSHFASTGSRICVWSLKCVPLFSIFVVSLRFKRVLRLLRRLRRSLPLVFVRFCFELWALTEVAFWCYFQWKKRSLEERRAYQPSMLWKAPGERLDSLRRVLASVEHIHVGDGFGSRQRHLQSNVPSSKLQQRKFRKKAEQRLVAEPSLENFLRWEQNADLGTAGVSLSTSPSVENLLRCWSSEKVNVMVAQKSELVCLKHIELCSWFTTVHPRRELCRDIHQIHRGNIEEWVLSYWFDGAESYEVKDFTPEEVDELKRLVDEVVSWAGLSELRAPPQGSPECQERNPYLECFRYRSDRFPAVHRPLFVNVCTAFFFPLMGHRVLSWLGFRPYRSGSMEYWFRACPAISVPKSGRPRLIPGDFKPLVFIHGVGIGPSMCLTFLQRLVRNLGSDNPIFVCHVGGISMSFEDDVASSTEVTANIAKMLQVWGFSSAHFIGHSFGTFVLAWMIRYQRSYIDRVSFIDPVCFLTLRMLKEGYELQQVRNDSSMNTMEMFIKYFVMTELFVCNFVCRCFFWEESQLDMRDLEGLLALVVLEADDVIVQVHSVRRLVLAEQHRRARKATSVMDASSLDLLWVEAQPHAGFLADAVANRELNARLHDFHLLARTGEGSKGGA